MGSLNDYTILKAIGKGSYGEVHLIQHKKERKQYVVKKMALQKASRRERKAAELEAKLLSKLKHPNIVSYKDSFESDEGFLYIVMGYAEGGDLYTRLREQREKNEILSETQVVRWFIQICMALQYLHQQNILHRDLKTQNIFLTKTKMIKVGDLGIARVLDGSSDMATTLIGTPYYMSPELFSNRPYNHKSDVWSLGCCVYEMTTLKHAFNAKDMNSLMYKILKNKMPKMPDIYSNELCDLIKNMLHQTAEKRPSVNRILRNSFIKKHIQLFLDESSKSRRPTSGRSRYSASDSSRKTSTSSVQSRSSSRNSNNPALEANSSANVYETPMPAISRDRAPAKPMNPPLLSNPIRQEPLYVNSKNKDDPKHVYDSVAQAQSSSKPAAVEEHIYHSIDTIYKAPEKELAAKVEGVKIAASSSKKVAIEHQDDSVLPVEKIPVVQDSTKPERTKSAESSGSSSYNSEERKQPQPVAGESQKRPLPPPRRNRKKETPEVKEEKKSALTSSGDTKSSTGGSVSSARERRRREKERKAREAKEALALRTPTSSVEIPTERKTSQRLTPPNEDSRRRESASAGEEVNQFYSLLHTTLRMNSQDDSPPLTPPNHSSGDTPPPDEIVRNKLSPVEEISESAVSTLTTQTDGPSQPSLSRPALSSNTPAATEIVVHAPPHLERASNRPITQGTLASTGRLMDRIVALRKECIRGLGVPLLHRAYELLDEDFDEDQLEKRLIKLLGEARFKQWAGKIWQLKFCEEAIFKHCGSITAY